MPDQTPEQREADLYLAKKLKDSPEWAGRLARAYILSNAENVRLREALTAMRVENQYQIDDITAALSGSPDTEAETKV